VLWFLVICAMWVGSGIFFHWGSVESRIIERGCWGNIDNVIICPLREEFLFRGLLQGLLDSAIVSEGRNVVKVLVSVAIQSCVFSLSHFDSLNDPVAFLVHFLGGMTLGVLVWRTKSIWPGVVIHGLGNLV